LAGWFCPVVWCDGRRGYTIFDLEKEGRENLDMVQVQGSDGWPGGVLHEKG